MAARRTARKKPKPEDLLPSAQDWRTTDEQEILKRQLRAREESMRLRNERPDHPVFSNFQVRSESGLIYRVEIRDVAGRQFSCTCADFRKNGLGTCKHVEAVLVHARAKAGRRVWEAAVAAGSNRIEIGLDDHAGLRLWRGWSAAPGRLRALFDDATRLLHPDCPPEAAAAEITRLAEKSPAIRLSQDVAPWLEERAAAAERLRLRREYEQNVQSGAWPAHETLVPLFPYQREGMLHLAFTERALLADEMGLGKTIQAIAACALLHRLGKARHVLVVTPASLKSEWEEQIAKFTPLACRVVFGGRLARLACYSPEAPFFTIVNYEQMVTDSLDVNERLRPDVVVLDEAQRIKNWNTKTAQAVKRLQSRYAFVLTGTPIENRIDELYSLVDFLDPRALGPLFRFNREFYAFDDKGRPKGYRNLTQLHARVRPLLLRRRKAEVESELPDRTDRQHFVTLAPLQREAYATHESQVAKLAMIAKRRALRLEEQKKLLRELAMMRMICDSNYILDPEDRESPKIDELRRILESALANEGVKIIVFSEWERMLELVRDVCRDLGTGFAWHTGSVPQQRRRLEINAFKNDPDCRIFLSTDAGATGLNLQNASVVINCDLPWTPAKLEQRIARAWRKNQTRPVTVVNLVAENTIEHRMLDTLANKSRLAEGVLDEGKLDTMDLRGSRDSLFKRLEQILAPQNIGHGTPVTSPPVPADPSLAIAQSAASILGPLLHRCEERPAGPGQPPVCLVVVERDAAASRERLRPVIDEAGERRVIEVLDRHAFDTLQRLTAAGLIAFTAAGTRELFPAASEPAAPAPLTAEERARLGQFMDSAKRQMRLAGVLGASEFAAEARAAWIAAASALAGALAVAARAEPPVDLPASLRDTALARWGAAGPAVQALAESSTSVPDSLPGALQTVLKRLLVP
jgi:hypothetical protein